MAAVFGLDFQTQIFWDGSKQPNILKVKARAHSLAARRLAQSLQEETHRKGEAYALKSMSRAVRPDNRS